MSAAGRLVEVAAHGLADGLEDSLSTAPTPRFMVPLDEANELSRVGGKAHNLARLLPASSGGAAEGFEVPAGFVVSAAAFDAFLAADGLGERLDVLCAGLAPRDATAIARVAAEARSLVLAARMPADVAAELHAASASLLRLGECAVRSSAIGEDSAEASFAGQLDSFLGIGEPAALEAAVVACWASYWSERALFYQLARAVRLRGMAVLVQRMVDARFAGVLFTHTGDGGMLAEYCAGLGDALVSGRVNPARAHLERMPLRVARHEPPQAEDGADAETAAGLPDADLIRLARVGLALEERLGGAQDVEWAVDGGGSIQLLQARLITAPLAAPAGSARVTTPAGHPAGPGPSSVDGPGRAPGALPPPAAGGPLTSWSNANVNENFPEPISPFLYSIVAAGYTSYFRGLARAFGISRRRIAAMEGPLNEIVGVHGARLYYNLTSIHAVLRMAPFGESLARAFNEFVGAEGVAPPPPGAAAFGDRGRARQLAEAVVIAGRSAWQYLFLERRVRTFEARADDFAARTHPAVLPGLPTGELLDRLREFMDIRCNRWTNAALADAASLVCYAVLRRLLATGLPAEERANGHNTLLKALPDVVSAVPARELWSLSRLIRGDAALLALFAETRGDALLHAIRHDARFGAFAAAFDRYLEAWGFRCSAELMLTLPSFQEQPGPLLELLATYARVDGESPEAVMARQDAERRAETRRVLSLLRRRRLLRFLPGVSYAPVAALALRWTQGAIIRRERVRLKQALLYSRCRRIALALGDRLAGAGRIETADDIFFLTVGEVDALAAGSAMFPYRVDELVASRRREHAELSAMRPPDAFHLALGEYLSVGQMGGAAADGAAGLHGAAKVSGAVDGVLRGESACGGQVTARAVVLQDVTEAAALEAGDVLVTRQTDPGWGPVFFLVSGLVIERGGMLSHGAIIAREFGIPCVIGVPAATHSIRSGSIVTVDGDAGLVHRHD